MSDFFYLEEELMMNVWLRLPIKPTLRFRCVSKSWCASLSDPQFIYKNLTLSDAENRNENDHLLVLDRKGKYYSVGSHEPRLATPRQLSPLLNVPAADGLFTDIVTHCCHDLVCFHSWYGDVIGVWNLTTGETKILPSLHYFPFKAIGFGFGFDDKIISRTGDDEDVIHDLWAFLDVGVSSSLTKLFNIDWHYKNKPMLPMGFWRNELVFQLDWNRLIMGDPSEESSSLKEVEINGPLDFIISCWAWTKGKNSVALN